MPALLKKDLPPSTHVTQQVPHLSSAIPALWGTALAELCNAY